MLMQSCVKWILQKVNYAKLIEDSDDDSDSDNGKSKKPFSSDDDDDLVDNTGIKERSMHQADLDESADLFDSLKEEESPKPKPKARKLGAKTEVVKDPSSKSTKRSKMAISDDDSPIKVIHKNPPSQTLVWSESNWIVYWLLSLFALQKPAAKKKKKIIESSDDDDNIPDDDSDSDFDM